MNAVPLTGQRASRIISQPSLAELAALRGQDVILRHVNGSRFDGVVVDDWSVEDRNYVIVHVAGENIALTDSTSAIVTDGLAIDVSRFAKVLVF